MRRQQQQHQQRNILGSDHMTGPINETFDAWCAHTYTKKTRSFLSSFSFSFTFYSLSRNTMTQVVKPAHNLANMDASMSAAAPSLAPNSNNNGYRK